MQVLSIKRISWVFGILFLALVLIFFHFRGIIFYDEGYILNPALRIVQGEVPYRNFDMVYTPLSFLITAGFLKLFGISVFAGRVAAITVSSLSLFALYAMFRLLKVNNMLIFICLLFYVAWGPAHLNFPWPIMFAACFSLYAIFFYLYGVTYEKKIYFFLSGIIAVLVFLSKQNFGTALLISSLVCMFFLDADKKWRYILVYLFGIISASLVAVLLLVSVSAFVPLINNLYYYTFQAILFGKALDTPFLYQGSLLTRLAKLLFYLLPFLFSVAAFMTALKFEKKIIIIPIFCGLFYFSGIRPTTDYVHIVGLFAVSVLSIAVIIQYAKNILFNRLVLLMIVCLMVLGFYTAYFGGYYKWETPLREQTYFDANPKIHVFISSGTAGLIDAVTGYIDRYTRQGEYIYINYTTPLWYLLVDRRNATAYDSVMPISLEAQKQIVSDLQKKHVRLVIVVYSMRNDPSIIGVHIRKDYHLDKIIGDYYMYIKR